MCGTVCLCACDIIPCCLRLPCAMCLYAWKRRPLLNFLHRSSLKNKQNQLPTRSWAPRRLESHTGVPKAARNVVPGAHGTSVWAPEAAPQV
ncbi:hypothetical protein MTR_2g083460 [Medicago truncatula]|uniref:Transmembrane protein n=1 Tax=Medicago truncatula TaxID=3880 RepID=G7IJQ4_MEDTR|nr:hypothetical protein MTR_2g083460 [Medicago truncatula]